MKHDSKSIINAIEKVVKIKIKEEEKENFLKSVDDLLEIMEKIYELNVESDDFIFINYPWQKLELQDDQEKSDLKIKFHRKTTENMIITHKFVDA